MLMIGAMEEVVVQERATILMTFLNLGMEDTKDPEGTLATMIMIMEVEVGHLKDLNREMDALAAMETLEEVISLTIYVQVTVLMETLEEATTQRVQVLKTVIMEALEKVPFLGVQGQEVVTSQTPKDLQGIAIPTLRGTIVRKRNQLIRSKMVSSK